jgi:amino acid adenylation domain-containing protein
MARTTDPALYRRFLRGLDISPHAVAVRIGTRRLTYAEAHREALAWAGDLVRAGTSAIGLLTAKGPTAYTGILAALYAGAAAVPLRPDFPADRTREMIRAAGIGALIVDAAGADALDALVPLPTSLRVLTPDAAIGERITERIGVPVLVPDGRRALARPVAVRAQDPAYVLFTSGSTGRPKGVVLTHGMTDHYFGWVDERYDFSSHDVFSQSFDLNFDCSLFDLFCAWGAGATAVAVPPQAYRDLPRFAAEQGLTVWFSTPSAIDLVRRMGGLGNGTLSGLRWSFFAGEAFKVHDAADWARAAANGPMENIYGPTELTITVSAYRWDGERTPFEAVNGIVPIGDLNTGHRRLLLVSEDDAGVPTTAADIPGVEGELCVAGPQLTPGYLDPGDGAGRFLEHEGERWYRTGDRVRVLAGGGLAYLGRMDSQVQIHGVRIELGEVEEAMRRCGAVDAVAVGVPVASGTELCAFYTGTPIPEFELVKRLRATLPGHAIPKYFQYLEAFPLNSNRKVDRKALAEVAR